MKSIVLFTEYGEWNPEDWIVSLNGKVTNNDQYMIEIPESWLSIYNDNKIFNDYEKCEEELVRSLLRNPTSYLIEWRGESLLQKFIDEFPVSKVAVVDNDHGLICRISELKGKPVSSWVNVKKKTI